MGNLIKVTMTGADDRTDVQDLINLQKQYPFVEWGILVGDKRGRPRFPTFAWQARYASRNADVGGEKTSCHLCGSVVRAIYNGYETLMGRDHQHPILHIAGRVQLNTHAEPHDFDLDNFLGKNRGFILPQVIVQYDGVNGDILRQLRNHVDAVPLFDLSHGAGVLPEKWPNYPGFLSGYAGGLSPDNLGDQLERINALVPEGQPYWIDAETHVRSQKDDVDYFDLEKVARFLEIAKGFMRA